MKILWKLAIFGAFCSVTTMAAAESKLPKCERYPAHKETYSCECAAGTTSGSVWGSGPYTADSDLCRAARHAGVIAEKGGEIVVSRIAGQSSYDGSSQNGVTTKSWGSYKYSIEIKVVQSAVAECAAFDPAKSPLTCTCAPADKRKSSVWGSSPYTTDSNICAAAQHTGLIGPEGGTVTVLALDGLKSYAGSEHNGVKTSDWGAYEKSFVFDWNAE